MEIKDAEDAIDFVIAVVFEEHCFAKAIAKVYKTMSEFGIKV